MNNSQEWDVVESTKILKEINYLKTEVKNLNTICFKIYDYLEKGRKQYLQKFNELEKTQDNLKKDIESQNIKIKNNILHPKFKLRQNNINWRKSNSLNQFYNPHVPLFLNSDFFKK